MNRTNRLSLIRMMMVVMYVGVMMVSRAWLTVLDGWDGGAGMCDERHG